MVTNLWTVQSNIYGSEYFIAVQNANLKNDSDRKFRTELQLNSEQTIE